MTTSLEHPAVAFHIQDSGTTYVNERNALTALVHEILGHGWNPVSDSPSREYQRPYGYDSSSPRSPWVTELGRKAYYVSNDAELSAAFGNLRKQLYRAYKVDAGEPRAFKSVYDTYAKDDRLLDRDAHNGVLSHDAVGLIRGLKALRDYNGRNLEILSRKKEVEALLSDEDFTKQLVQVSPIANGPARAYGDVKV